MSYALGFWRLTITQSRILNQILAVPLRRALGLHRSASAIRTLWECSIPTVQTIRRVVLLQSVSRAVRSSDAGNLMPSLLRDDILRVDQDSGPAYCRPFKHELAAIVQEFPDVRLPMRQEAHALLR